MSQLQVTAEPQETGISRPPTGGEKLADRFFRGLCQGFAWLTIILVVLIVWEIGKHALPAMQAQGLEFLTGDKWDASANKFGILPEILGTLYSSLVGVGLATILGVAVAIFLTQDFLPPAVEVALKNIIELLAAIPSVVYGLWGIFVVIPAIRPACNWLHDHLGWVPIFGTRLSGPGLLPAALVLAIMVLPTITAISRDAMSAVPPRLREAAYGLGATKWETILAVILPTSSRGIFGSIILGFGRALGETMALAMLAGNASNVSWSLFAPSNTLAALVANKFPEASRIEIDALMYAALVLLVITLAVNMVGTWIIMRTAVDTKGARSMSAIPHTPAPPPPMDTFDLQRRLREPRTLFNAFMSWLVGGLTILAMVPLFSVLIMLIWRGGQRLGITLFTDLPPAAGMVGGGIGNALLGTIIMVGVATLISVPVGILGGVYLAEFGPATRTATAVRFAAKVLTGLPSIIAGVFIYALIVTVMGSFSALAGGVALSILMLPTIILTAEDAVRMVPQKMREAAVGMGCTPTQTVLQVVLPAARPGILTGVMLAVARAAGETAPLLFTALFSDYWIRRLNEPAASLAVIIYDFSGQPYPNLIEIAWAASLVLVLIVLGLNIASQVYLRRALNK